MNELKQLEAYIEGLEDGLNSEEEEHYAEEWFAGVTWILTAVKAKIAKIKKDNQVITHISNSGLSYSVGVTGAKDD